MTTRRRQQPLNTEPPRASRTAAKVADEIQSATLEWLSPHLFYTFNFLTHGVSGGITAKDRESSGTD